MSEFTLSLMDHRLLCGDKAVYGRLAGVGLAKMLERGAQGDRGGAGAADQSSGIRSTGTRLFHLEPNIKDCPGGLRDVHVCAWLKRLGEVGRSQNGVAQRSRARGMATGGSPGFVAADRSEFGQAVEFLLSVRCFLHYRHERDDNTLDWQAQDAAAAKEIGMGLDRRHARRTGWRRAWMRRTGCGCTSAMRGAWSAD